MKHKSNEIDGLFRKGFQGEEKFVDEIPQDRFDDLFPVQSAENVSPQFWNRKFWLSVAASLLFAAFGFWYFLNPNPIQPETVAMLTGAENSEAILPDYASTIPAEEIQNKNQAKAKAKISEVRPEKSKNRKRKKRLGATLFPGIFTPMLITSQVAFEKPVVKDENLAAESFENFSASKIVNSDSALALVSVEKTVQEFSPNEANQIASIEFYPGPYENKSEEINEGSPEIQENKFRKILNKVTKLDVTGLPTVEEAKGLLFAGIGRLMGFDNQAETTENSNTESN